MSQSDAPPVSPPKPPKKPPKPQREIINDPSSGEPVSIGVVDELQLDTNSAQNPHSSSIGNRQSSADDVRVASTDRAVPKENDSSSKSPAPSPPKSRLKSMTSDIVGSVGSIFSTMGMKTTEEKATANPVDRSDAAQTTGIQEEENAGEGGASSTSLVASSSKSRLKSMTSDIVVSIMSINMRTNSLLPAVGGLSPRRRASVATDAAADPTGGIPGAIRHGILSKMNREGKFERNLFTLTATHLSYRKDKRQSKSDNAGHADNNNNNNDDDDDDDFRPISTVSTMSTISSSTVATTTTTSSEIGSDDTSKNMYPLETILIL